MRSLGSAAGLPRYAAGHPRRTRTHDLKNKNPREQARGGEEGKEVEVHVLPVRMKAVERVVAVGAMPRRCAVSSHPRSRRAGFDP